MYETIRHRITRFDEVSPEERKELFERVWKLREHLESNQEDLPKPQVALLHDALTHAALYFIEIYDRERKQLRADETTATESGSGVASLDEYRKHLKAS